MARWFIALVLAAFLGPFAQAEELRGRVVGVTDGDTLTILDAAHRQHTIRLAEIDAPEKRQPYGERAKQALSALAFGKDARAVAQTRDRYGRTVARVFVIDGDDDDIVETDVSAAMIGQGAAWVFTRYARDPRLPPLEDEARTAQRGLWALPAADRLPPWEWRMATRTRLP